MFNQCVFQQLPIFDQTKYVQPFEMAPHYQSQRVSPQCCPISRIYDQRYQSYVHGKPQPTVPERRQNNQHDNVNFILNESENGYTLTIQRKLPKDALIDAIYNELSHHYETTQPRYKIVRTIYGDKYILEDAADENRPILTNEKLVQVGQKLARKSFQDFELELDHSGMEFQVKSERCSIDKVFKFNNDSSVIDDFNILKCGIDENDNQLVILKVELIAKQQEEKQANNDTLSNLIQWAQNEYSSASSSPSTFGVTTNYDHEKRQRQQEIHRRKLQQQRDSREKMQQKQRAEQLRLQEEKERVERERAEQLRIQEQQRIAKHRQEQLRVQEQQRLEKLRAQEHNRLEKEREYQLKIQEEQRMEKQRQEELRAKEQQRLEEQTRKAREEKERQQKLEYYRNLEVEMANEQKRIEKLKSVKKNDHPLNGRRKSGPILENVDDEEESRYIHSLDQSPKGSAIIEDL
ncbi:uncharacterized protein NDAI_0I02800 [Naumovozyma dairenensis CBS 421]|uniref:Uncharacterized protein n=1 Tax=Naumovozyma dairenensis (strain ATCC 10597 / BCRC 20456 / CBS 421 / NBRC 0211 / NRRL Y-12639) TaxID=1071378 RepID=G0WGD7_NAUDC|nr:hypothetical protein NDAI_0I02800 [Naumovozyma dairenensis CBS 421]CCD26848.1 hypothetical protein NDAI_0I02800 [Naumovozyma dairenensis CBS 421]